MRPISTVLTTGLRVLALAVALAAAPCSGPFKAQQAAADPITPLVSVDWLAAHTNDSGLVILDIRSAIDGSTPETFAKGHIPKAIPSDYDKGGWRSTRNGVPFMLPSLAQLEKLIGELGIDEDNRVVIYPAGVSASDFGSATRVYCAEFYDERTNRLKTLPELKAIAARLPATGEVINYCNTGHWSSTDWFVLSELLGRKDVKVYYGSIVDWTMNPNRPVTSSRTKWDDIKKFFGQGS